jgi:hypothetical protein
MCGLLWEELLSEPLPQGYWKASICSEVVELGNYSLNAAIGLVRVASSAGNRHARKAAKPKSRRASASVTGSLPDAP